MQKTAAKAEASRRVDFISPQLAAAMSHPTRVYAMGILTERDASPRELADHLGEPLNNVTYHVNQLRDLGCIELVRTERARGGRVLEHFYRTTQRPYFDEDAWAVLSGEERRGVIWSIAQMISKDITAAIASGSFFAEDDKHISRSPMSVDEEGWGEISELLNRTSKELLEIEERVAGRTDDGAPARVDAKVEILQFRSPAGEWAPRS
jgi:DNA-binding transcriptional ArsR family regulator